MTEAAPTTAPEAAALLEQRVSDPSFGQKLLAGDVATRREFDQLTTMVVNADTGVEALAGGKSSQIYPWTGEGQLAPQHVAQSVEWLRQIGLSDDVIKQVIDGDQAPVSRVEYDTAKRLMAQRQNDQEWVDQLMKGNSDVRREFTLLSVILNSTIKEEAAA